MRSVMKGTRGGGVKGRTRGSGGQGVSGGSEGSSRGQVGLGGV